MNDIPKTESDIEVYIHPSPSTMRPIFSEKRGLPKGGRVRIGTSNVQIVMESIEKLTI